MDKNTKKTLRINLIFSTVLLLLALFSMMFFNRRPPANVAVLTYGDKNERMEIPLDKNEIYHVDTGYYTVNIEVKDGSARFIDSPCPDHVCEGFGWLTKDGDGATCLPALASLVVLENN